MENAVFIPQDIFEIMGKGLVVTGSLISGELKKGMQFNTETEAGIIQGIEVFRKTVEVVKVQDEFSKSVGVLIVGCSKQTLEKYITNKQPLIFKATETSKIMSSYQPSSKFSSNNLSVQSILFICGLFLFILYLILKVIKII